MFKKRKGDIEETMGLSGLVLIGGIILAIIFIFIGFSDALQSFVGLRGGVNLHIQIDDAGSKALAVAAMETGRLSVTDIAGRAITEDATGELQKIIEGLEKKIQEMKDAGIAEVSIKDSSGNTIRKFGTPREGSQAVDMAVPLPGGRAGLLEVS